MQHATGSVILPSFCSHKELSQLKRIHEALACGFHMTGQGRSYGLAWEGIGPPTGEPDPANLNNFSPHKGFITNINAPQFYQLSWGLVSDDSAGEKAGCGVPGLRL